MRWFRADPAAATSTAISAATSTLSRAAACRQPMNTPIAASPATITRPREWTA
jgi:hypothetical protein